VEKEELNDSMLPALIAELIPALIQVESGGIDDAKGDLHKGVYRAVGCLQIWPIYLDDVNEMLQRSGDNYTYKMSDRLHRGHSMVMATIYLTHYGKASRLNPSSKMDWLLKLAKIHHGGPKNFNNNDYIYAQKVRKELE
jgi:hypothetical protein